MESRSPDATGGDRPSITVAIPTFSRPRLLARAMASVLGQTRDDWELVVSDDGPEGSESWRLASELAAADPRVRVVRNPGPAGQVGNTNHALGEARGEWVKILHDDDVLKPTCLEELARVAARSDAAVCVVCDAEVHAGDGSFRVPRTGGWPLLELVPGREVPVAMYMLEDLVASRPSQLMVHRRVIEAGVRMTAAPGIRTSLLDSWFKARLGGLGDLLLYRRCLVEWHQGHRTITDGVGPDLHDREMIALRDLLWSLVRDRDGLPAPETMKDVVRLQRAGWRMRSEPFRGLGEAARVRAPRAWYHFARWGLHRLSRGRVRVSRRRVLVA